MMVEIERNPLVVRQGAAAVACIAIAAAAMPVIAHRAEQQREGAATAEATRYETELAASLFAARGPDARIELVSSRADDGLRARGRAVLGAGGTHAMLVEAALRGPMPDAAAPGALNARELRCLAEAVYYEARGESYLGQVAVAEVVMNRARSRVYPRSVCGVVYQGSHRATGCQFTFTCDGSMSRGPRGQAWVRAQHVARQVMSGFERPVTGRATHYHTTAVDPYWSSSLVETGRVGEHVFYRFPNVAERRAMIASGAIQIRRARPAAPVYGDGVDEAPVVGAALADAVEEDAPIALTPPAPSAARDAAPVIELTPISQTTSAAAAATTLSPSTIY